MVSAQVSQYKLTPFTAVKWSQNNPYVMMEVNGVY